MLSNSLSSLNKDFYVKNGILLDDQFECLASILAGLCECFDRYKEFLKIYDRVYKAEIDSKSNPNQYDLPKLTKEARIAENEKVNFESSLLEQVDFYVCEYSNMLPKLIDDFKIILQNMYKEEDVIFSDYSEFLK